MKKYIYVLLMGLLSFGGQHYAMEYQNGDEDSFQQCLKTAKQWDGPTDLSLFSNIGPQFINQLTVLKNALSNESLVCLNSITKEDWKTILDDAEDGDRLCSILAKKNDTKKIVEEVLVTELKVLQKTG